MTGLDRIYRMAARGGDLAGKQETTGKQETRSFHPQGNRVRYQLD